MIEKATKNTCIAHKGYEWGPLTLTTEDTYILHQGGEITVGTKLYLLNAMFRHAASGLGPCADQ